MNDLHPVRGVTVPFRALVLTASRSSGPGGQNVNKLETRVEVSIDLSDIIGLSDDDRARIRRRCASRMAGGDLLRVGSQRFRSQWKNRQDALQKLNDLLRDALRREKKRIATRPGAGSREKRIRSKKLRANVKRSRSAPRRDED